MLSKKINEIRTSIVRWYGNINISSNHEKKNSTGSILVTPDLGTRGFLMEETSLQFIHRIDPTC